MLALDCFYPCCLILLLIAAPHNSLYVFVASRSFKTSRDRGNLSSQLTPVALLSPCPFNSRTLLCYYSPDVSGTVNDPIPFPESSKSHGSYHWGVERGLSAALVPLVIATAVTSANPILDGVLSVALVAHSHMVGSLYLPHSPARDYY